MGMNLAGIALLTTPCWYNWSVVTGIRGMWLENHVRVMVFTVVTNQAGLAGVQ